MAERWTFNDASLCRLVPGADWPQLEADATLGRAVRTLLPQMRAVATRPQGSVYEPNPEHDMLWQLIDLIEQHTALDTAPEP